MGSHPDQKKFTMALDDIRFHGSGLHRPECVLCARRGDIYVSGSRGGVTWIRPDGNLQLIVRRPIWI